MLVWPPFQPLNQHPQPEVRYRAYRMEWVAEHPNQGNRNRAVNTHLPLTVPLWQQKIAYDAGHHHSTPHTKTRYSLKSLLSRLKFLWTSCYVLLMPQPNLVMLLAFSVSLNSVTISQCLRTQACSSLQITSCLLHCQLAGKISSSTTNSWLSGLRFWHEYQGAPWLGGNLLRIIKAGVEKMIPPSSKR